MKIILDAMGGDNAPEAPVLGAIEAAKVWGSQITLVGRGEEILAVMKKNGIDNLPAGMEIANADDVVDMHDDPANVVRKRKNSSMIVGLKMLSEDLGDAFVSAGNTGALLTVATLVAKRIKGIKRAALCPVIPTEQGQCVLLDSGANNECSPEMLLQFAYMGAFYAEKYLNIENPRVGLLNNGAEETKGGELQKEAYALLKDAEGINFVGNAEARDVPLGKVDVVVCDGFSGNILLKGIEGTAIFMAHEMKKMFKKNLGSKLGYLLCKSGVDDIKKLMSSDEVGGAMFLGITKPIVKGHGSSDDYAMKNAIRQAKICVETGVCDAILENIDKMTPEKA